jgi:uncharacterized protein (DUF58 family)
MTPDQAQSWVAAGEQIGSSFLLAMPERAAIGAAGIHLGHGQGASVEFREHREYQPGDDLRHLDWNASARSDRLIVKLFREEVSPCLDLVVDGSSSMALPGSAKAEAAVGLAALLCTAAAGAGWSHSTWWTGDSCRQLPGGALHPPAWCQPFSAATNPGEALHSRPPAWRPRGIRMMISDLLWPGLPGPTLQRLAAGSAATAVLRVVSSMDLVPVETGNLRLTDVETGDQLEVGLDSTTADAYRRAITAHHQQWQEAATRHGVTLATIIAEQLVSGWDLSELVRLGLLQAAP